MKLKKWLVSGLAVCALFMSVAAVAPAAFADGINEEALQSLGISEEEFDAAKETARVAAIEEAAASGWITNDEADELIENGRSLRLGRGWYYEGIIDEEALLADALDISVAELEAAETETRQAHEAEAVANGRLTEEEVVNKQAAYDFKESLDKDALLATALGISVADLNEARADTVRFEDLLADLGLTAEEAHDAQDAALETAVQQAVEAGTLTAAQAEAVLEYGGCGGGRGDRPAGQGQPRGGQERGGQGPAGNGNPPPAQGNNA